MHAHPPKATIRSIEYHLPEGTVSNDDLARQYPLWSAEKIFAKTGIRLRHLADPKETACDLAVIAAEKLLASGVCNKQDIGLLVLCTQSPDYALPTTACIIQDRLGLPTSCLAFDYNLGCSGYVVGLSMVKAMLEAGLVPSGKALLLTAETYSKWMDPADHSVRTIFGDGAAATLIELAPSEDGHEFLGPFLFGTDGGGYQRLIVRESGARRADDSAAKPGQPPCTLFMDGPEIFNFTVKTVPPSVQGLLARSGRTIEQVDWFVFHQANTYMLEHLRKRCGIPQEKFVIDLADYGNTVSCTIPIVLANMSASGRLKRGDTVALVAFGVGYSWACNLLTWT